MTLNCPTNLGGIVSISSRSPEDCLNTLRELVNRSVLTDDMVDEFITLFDMLDDHVSNGGQLPEQWRQ
jgi:hypothetical protein